MNSESDDLSLLLARCAKGDQEAEREVFEKAYAELKRLSRLAFARESKDSSLQPTLLINEAFMRMPKAGAIQWQGRQHFFAIATRAMRRTLVDHARLQSAQKRPQKVRQDLDALDRAGEFVEPANALIVHEALTEFAKLDPRRAKTVELHYFGGLTYGEIAEITGRNEDAVKKDWKTARLWLLNFLRGTGPRD